MLKKYQDFQGMFKKEAHEKLPEHQNWDHEILLGRGKKPTYGPIYALSETELKILREYLDKNLKKGFIQPFTSCRALAPVAEAGAMTTRTIMLSVAW